MPCMGRALSGITLHAGRGERGGNAGYQLEEYNGMVPAFARKD